MNIFLWILQIFFGLTFIATGVLHFVVPEGLPAMMSWMYDLPSWLHWISGTAEILGGLGLILPGVFRIQTRLVPLAAFGLCLVMVGAVIFHLTRGEYLNLVMNIFYALVMAFVAYGRSVKWPLSEQPTLAKAT